MQALHIMNQNPLIMLKELGKQNALVFESLNLMLHIIQVLSMVHIFFLSKIVAENYPSLSR